MSTRTLSRVGAGAVVLTSLVTGCASATLGVPAGTIIATVSTVIANLPAATTESRGTTGSSTVRRARIPPSPPPTPEASRVLHIASTYLGVRYVWGGNTPSQGFDCSGFTKYIFAKVGITLPRTSREQAHAGRAVPADFADLRPGDLMLFAEPGQAISHVAIYAGDGRIIHSSTSTHGVGYTDLQTGGDWFVAYFVAARRVD